MEKARVQQIVVQFVSLSLTNDLLSLPRTDLDENSCPMISYSQSDSNNNNTSSALSSQKQKKFLQLLSNTSALYGVNSMKSSTNTSASSSSSSFYNQPKSYSGSNSSSSSSCASSLADIDDITIVKEEPLSPHSSCPPSPNCSNYGNALPSISSINPDLMYDRKVSMLFGVLCHLLKDFIRFFAAIAEESRSALPYLSNLHYITNQNGTITSFQ
jgi:hypothetical protein